MKKDRLKGIITALKQEDCVLFIGSGISTWSGLPSWAGLLDELADYLEECGEDSSLVKEKQQTEICCRRQAMDLTG